MSTKKDPLAPLRAHAAPDSIGIGVPEGWVPLMTELHAALVAVCPEIRYVQVKQKFAELRVYVSGATPEVEQLIWAAEAKSRTICEVCGEPGSPWVRRGWYRALCPDHADELGYTVADG